MWDICRIFVRYEYVGNKIVEAIERRIIRITRILMELFVLSTPSMVFPHVVNSHEFSPFEGRGFRALGPIKKGEIYLKVGKFLQFFDVSDPFLACLF